MQSPLNALLQDASTESPLFMQFLSTAESAQISGGFMTGVSGVSELNVYSLGNIPVRTASTTTARPPTVSFERLGRFVESFLRTPGPYTDERSVQTVNQVFTNLSSLDR